MRKFQETLNRNSHLVTSMLQAFVGNFHSLFQQPKFPLIVSIFVMSASQSLLGQTADSLRASTQHQIVSYVEILGHNYYGFSTDNDRGLISINFSTRDRIGSSHFHILFAVGWGTFTTYQPSNSTTHGRVHYIPCESSIQLGRRNHFFEVGFAVVQEFGEQRFVYEGDPGGVGPTPEIWVFRKYSFELVPRIGYVYCADRGLMIRFAFTPHLFPTIYNKYEGYRLVKPVWVPIGISIGWSFKRNGIRKTQAPK